MTGKPREEEGWREPTDIRDLDWWDDDPDGGALVPAKPRPAPAAPAMALEVSIDD